MDPALVPVTTVLLLLVGGLMTLTGLGALRRGRSRRVALVAAVVFPVTWAAWYVRDERPYGGRAR